MIIALEEINFAYNSKLFSVVDILLRKFIENLLIDILRKKFGMSSVGLFFDEKQGQFLPFLKLLENFKAKIGELKIYSKELNPEFINKINEFRIRGNSKAHSIELLDKDRLKNEIDKTKNDMEFVLKLLIRVFGLI